MKKTIVSVILMTNLGAAHCETLYEAVANCKGIKNEHDRLVCYENIGARVTPPTAATAKNTSSTAYSSMSLLDLKADIKSLVGKKVAVSGSLQMVGELAMLSSGPMDMTPVMVNIDKLPRDDRKQALKGCLTYCGVQINGTVKNGPLGQQLNAEQVVWK